ncbi:MAG TPA: hypothetical protein VGB56_14145, partial [Flavisolibacter sp.]
MKQHISKLIAPLFWTVVLLAACSKKDQLPELPSQPIPAGAKGSIRFSAGINLSGMPYHSSKLTAVVSIANDKNEEVVKETMLTLTLDGGARTEALELPVGNYKLTKFRLVYGGVQTHFAAPNGGSAKAALVRQPLPVAFTVTKSPGTDIAVEVLRVQRGERPSLFGYSSGAFDNGQSDADPYMKIKVRAVMKIGDVLYDSIPASLQLSTWNQNGEMTTTYLSLQAATNEISVLKAGTRFRLHVSKWGTSTELILNRQDVVEDTVYILGSTKAAKLLKAEMTYKLVNGSYVPQSKNEYLYDANGKLSWINYYLKRADNSSYIAMHEEFEYAGARVQAIRRYNEANALSRTTTFSYTTDGKVSSINQNENGQQTTGRVEYYSDSEPQVKIHYAYAGQPYSRDYIMTFNRGNVFEDISYTSNQTSEMGRYDHDLQINPYIHMNWPNLSLSNSSKNNLTRQYKTYQYQYPDSEPYSFTYTYDS